MPLLTPLGCALCINFFNFSKIILFLQIFRVVSLFYVFFCAVVCDNYCKIESFIVKYENFKTFLGKYQKWAKKCDVRCACLGMRCANLQNLGVATQLWKLSIEMSLIKVGICSTTFAPFFFRIILLAFNWFYKIFIIFFTQRNFFKKWINYNFLFEFGKKNFGLFIFREKLYNMNI